MSVHLRMLLVAGALCLMLICGVAGIIVYSRASASAQELAAARARWAERPFNSYQVDARFLALQPHRQVDLFCQHGTALRLLDEPRQPCQVLDLTVAQLFQRIEHHQQTSDCTHYPNCTCRNGYTVHVRYDDDLGYPHTLVIWHAEAWPNWNHPDFWQFIWEEQQIPTCQIPNRHKETLQVLALEPLP